MRLEDIQKLVDNKNIDELKIIGLKKLEEITHPDLFPAEQKDLAATLFKEIHTILDRRIKVGQYTLRDKLWNGDLTDIYGGNDIIAKIVRSSSNNSLLDNERNNLDNLYKSGPSLGDYLPEFKDSLTIRSKGKRARRANIFSYSPNYITLKEVGEKFSEGLDGRHIAWIFKRCLVCLGLNADAGIVHTAILPEHILINPQNHGGKLIGWTLSKKQGEKQNLIVKGRKMFYSPRILNKEGVSLWDDLYMLAKCMISISKELPKPIDNFLLSLLMEGEIRHPWDLHEDFDKVLLKVYGLPKFIKLEV